MDLGLFDERTWLQRARSVEATDDPLEHTRRILGLDCIHDRKKGVVYGETVTAFIGKADA